MAVFPIPPEPVNWHDSDRGDFENAALDQETLRTLRAFLELLDQWDRQGTPDL